MAANQTIIAGTASQPFFVPARSVFTATPAAGATATVEYTTDGAAAIANRVAVFKSWPKGPVTSATSDMVNTGVYMRVTANGGNVVATVEDSPSGALTAQYSRNWGGSNSSPYILAQSAVPVNLTGNTVELAMASVIIPGGLLGPNGSIRVTSVWSSTNNANVKSVITRLGGTNAALLNITSCATYREQRQIQNRNSAGSQVCFSSAFGGFSVSGVAIATLAKDTSVDQVLALVGQLTNAADTLTLEAYNIEVLPGL